jgi:type I restriction enzyme S subunit
MSDWEESSLADLADYINGRAIKPEECSSSDGIPVIRIKQINNAESIEDRFCGEGLDEKNIARSGDLLFSWSATLKTILWQGPTGAINQHIFKVLPKEDIDRTFLHYLIDHSIPALAEESHGSTMKHIKKSALSAFRLPIPPLPEQKKIAEILSGIDKQIFAHQKKLEKNQRVSKGVLSGMLAWFEEETRDTKRLVEDIFVETSTPETHNSETPLYSLTIESGLVPKPDRYVRDFLLTDKEKDNYKLITKGDFVMNPMNLRWGAISAFHKESSAKISKYYTTFRARDDRASARFYEFLFRSDQYLRLYERIATGSLIEKMRVHWSAFRKLEIPFPSLEEQKNFESLSSSLEFANSRTEDLIAKLKVFRSAVASELLSGRKRVSV